jgi:hypothetical protein
MDARRRRLLRLSRLALLGLLVAWFFSPPRWRYVVPLWLPFAAAVLLEVQFFVQGVRRGATGVPSLAPGRDRGPQPHDLAELGWPQDEQPEEDDAAFWHSPPAPRRSGRRGLPRRLVETAAVLAAVALVALAVSIRRGWSSLPSETQTKVERALSREAQTIAAHRVQVRCDSSGRHVGVVQEADGVAEVGGDEAWITPGLCYRLYALSEKGDVSSFSGTGRAIAVLAHEAWHLRGVRDEGIANCYAFQSGVGIGVRLGLSRGTARDMMRQQLANNAMDSGGDSRYLVPAGCENGGRYDLDAASSGFP